MKSRFHRERNAFKGKTKEFHWQKNWFVLWQSLKESCNILLKQKYSVNLSRATKVSIQALVIQCSELWRILFKKKCILENHFPNSDIRLNCLLVSIPQS